MLQKVLLMCQNISGKLSGILLFSHVTFVHLFSAHSEHIQHRPVYPPFFKRQVHLDFHFNHHSPNYLLKQDFHAQLVYSHYQQTESFSCPAEVCCLNTCWKAQTDSITVIHSKAVLSAHPTQAPPKRTQLHPVTGEVERLSYDRNYTLLLFVGDTNWTQWKESDASRDAWKPCSVFVFPRCKPECNAVCPLWEFAECYLNAAWS